MDSQTDMDRNSIVGAYSRNRTLIHHHRMSTLILCSEPEVLVFSSQMKKHIQNMSQGQASNLLRCASV
jgi:hypothetical protein